MNCVMKTCSDCRSEKPASEYRKHSDGSTMRYCNECHLEKRRAQHATSSDVIAGLEMALSQAEAMIERQQHVMQRAMDAWDATTHQKNGDGRLWQCMEELRGEIGQQKMGRKQ